MPRFLPWGVLENSQSIFCFSEGSTATSLKNLNMHYHCSRSNTEKRDIANRPAIYGWSGLFGRLFSVRLADYCAMLVNLKCSHEMLPFY